MSDVISSRTGDDTGGSSQLAESFFRSVPATDGAKEASEIAKSPLTVDDARVLLGLVAHFNETKPTQAMRGHLHPIIAESLRRRATTRPELIQLGLTDGEIKNAFRGEPVQITDPARVAFLDLVSKRAKLALGWQ